MIYINPTQIHLHIKPTILIMFDIYHFHVDQTLMDEGGEPPKEYDRNDVSYCMVRCVMCNVVKHANAEEFSPPIGNQ